MHVFLAAKKRNLFGELEESGTLPMQERVALDNVRERHSALVLQLRTAVGLERALVVQVDSVVELLQTDVVR